jgi:dTDP-4-dehydrorhamnose 3,5-epimerase
MSRADAHSVPCPQGGLAGPPTGAECARMWAGLSFIWDHALPMEILPARIPGPALIVPSVFGDERGFFVETYRQQWHSAAGIPEHELFLQDNHSRSARGVVRGMHFHVGDGVAKLVRCGRGRILDVVVDLRRGSPSYGEWEGFELDDESMSVLYVPVGFAHGFCVLSDVADVIYKQSAYYDPAIERGIAWNDPDVAIDWPLPLDELTVSARDSEAPLLREFAPELPFEYAG